MFISWWWIIIGAILLYGAGASSKQGEIDELKEKIEELEEDSDNDILSDEEIEQKIWMDVYNAKEDKKNKQ